MRRGLLARIIRPMVTGLVSKQSIKISITNQVHEGWSHCWALPKEKKTPSVRTQMLPQEAARLAPVLVLFAVALVPALAPVLAATRHEALDSSRLYSYLSALRVDATVEGQTRSRTGSRVRARCSS